MNSTKKWGDEEVEVQEEMASMNIDDGETDTTTQELESLTAGSKNKETCEKIHNIEVQIFDPPKRKFHPPTDYRRRSFRGGRSRQPVANKPARKCANEHCENVSTMKYCQKCHDEHVKSKVPCQKCETLTHGRFCFNCRKDYRANLRLCETCDQMTPRKYCRDCFSKMNICLTDGCERRTNYDYCGSCHWSYHNA